MCRKRPFATYADRLRPRLEGGRLPGTGPASPRWNNVTRSNTRTAPVEHSDGSHRAEMTSLPGERVRSGMSPSSNDTGRADSTQSLADGHHVDDAGMLIFCTDVDVRAPAERCPIFLPTDAAPVSIATTCTAKVIARGWGGCRAKGFPHGSMRVYNSTRHLASCRGGLFAEAVGLLPQRQTLEDGQPTTDTSYHAAGVVPKARRDDTRFGLPLHRRTCRDSFRRSVRERPRATCLA